MIAFDFKRIALRRDDRVGLEHFQRHAVLLLEQAIRQLIACQAPAQFMFRQPHHLLIGGAARLKQIQRDEQLIGQLHLQHRDFFSTNTFPGYYSVGAWDLGCHPTLTPVLCEMCSVSVAQLRQLGGS